MFIKIIGPQLRICEKITELMRPDKAHDRIAEWMKIAGDSQLQGFAARHHFSQATKGKNLSQLNCR